MKNKFLTKRPRNRLPGIVIYCSFLAYRCYMGRGVLRQMLNCPVNFTHIYCTVPISRASFSAIENTETRTYQSLRLGKNLNKLREAGWNSLAGYKVFSRVRYWGGGYLNISLTSGILKIVWFLLGTRPWDFNLHIKVVWSWRSIPSVPYY